MVPRRTKRYLPAFRPSKQVTSALLRAHESLIFPSSWGEIETVSLSNLAPWALSDLKPPYAINSSSSPYNDEKILPEMKGKTAIELLGEVAKTVHASENPDSTRIRIRRVIHCCRPEKITGEPSLLSRYRFPFLLGFSMTASSSKSRFREVVISASRTLRIRSSACVLRPGLWEATQSDGIMRS